MKKTKLHVMVMSELYTTSSNTKVTGIIHCLCERLSKKSSLHKKKNLFKYSSMFLILIAEDKLITTCDFFLPVIIQKVESLPLYYA